MGMRIEEPVNTLVSANHQVIKRQVINRHVLRNDLRRKYGNKRLGLVWKAYKTNERKLQNTFNEQYKVVSNYHEDPVKRQEAIDKLSARFSRDMHELIKSTFEQEIAFPEETKGVTIYRDEAKTALKLDRIARKLARKQKFHTSENL